MDEDVAPVGAGAAAFSRAPVALTDWRHVDFGALTNHVESGEEIFEVRLNPTSGDVTYRIRAASRPRAPLARLGYPSTRWLQARFRHDSARAARRAVERGA